MAALLALGAAAPARAQADLFSPSTLSGVLDLRLVDAPGERAWIDGGFGKARDGAGDRGLRLGDAAVAWRPRMSDQVGAVVTVELQPRLRPDLGLGEAYLTWRTGADRALQISARAGLFYPPLSLEHDGVLWTTPDTITPSAINSWVAEEIKVGGLEATVRTGWRGQPIALTAGLFGYGDTAGTLLSLRGWALHDLKSTDRSVMPLPPLSRYMSYRQAPHSTSILEIDHRIGAYGRVEWRPLSRLALDVFAYDNRGDLVGVKALEWAWATRFVDVGARLTLDSRTRIKVQLMDGETLMGYRDAGQLWIDAGFASGYLSVTRDLGPGALTARGDYFAISDRTLKTVDNNAEAGWALTAAYRWDVARRANILFEALHIDSDRPARLAVGLDRRQRQTVLQTALRLDF